jgi:hypothetical protein
MHARSRSDWKDPVFLTQKLTENITSSQQFGDIPDGLNIHQLIQMYEKISRVPNLFTSHGAKDNSITNNTMNENTSNSSKTNSDTSHNVAEEEDQTNDVNDPSHFQKVMTFWNGMIQRMEALEKENAALRVQHDASSSSSLDN